MVKWLVGAREIGLYMGWSTLKVMRMGIKYGFPLMRLPAQTRQGWAYQTTPELITAWYSTQVEKTREHTGRLKLGKAAPVREGKPAPVRPSYWRKPSSSPTNPQLTSE